MVGLLAIWLGGAAGSLVVMRERARWDLAKAKTIESAEALERKTYDLIPRDGMAFYTRGKTPTDRLTIRFWGSGTGSSSHFDVAGFTKLGIVDVSKMKPAYGLSKPAALVEELLAQIRSQDPGWRDAGYYRSSPNGRDPNTSHPYDTGSIGLVVHDLGVISLTAYPAPSSPNLVTVAVSFKISDRLPRAR